MDRLNQLAEVLTNILAQSQSNNRALAHLCEDAGVCPNSSGSIVPSMVMTTMAVAIVLLILAMRG